VESLLNMGWIAQEQHGPKDEVFLRLEAKRSPVPLVRPAKQTDRNREFEDQKRTTEWSFVLCPVDGMYDH
jgi:hypothetical protein